VSWRPNASLQTLKVRARMLAAAREFFAERRVLEVETPILSGAAVSDPQLESLRTCVKGMAQPYYLNTSPEYAMKRLLAAGSGDIFQICKVFRDEEHGRWHNPEFTMLEWYRLGFDDEALMEEIAQLLAHLVAPRSLPAIERISYAAALRRFAGVDIDSTEAELAAAARANGVHCASELDRDARLDLLMGLVVGPRLGREAPCFVTDYPASQAALARLKKTVPKVAARFELYYRGVELANGFHELCDAREQRRRFAADLELRERRGQLLASLDEHLLGALEHGLPDCAGVALGFDRLIAVVLDAPRLSEAMAFGIERA
jgi:lysyl-tRNA synthetase class 2